ncbi:class I SAM-dependent methyltransferase [Lapidilactobacillus achengensis]|uniref:Class I SAM-dependent methyltransferase n=1 Tax=Lapidilactobacillus achengensis TaxID=2486000 RepID=A0ABW1UR32_9LACO|nr:class I SAM-dependent methyltransferase [Lapidilactobacillus achengensis]
MKYQDINARTIDHWVHEGWQWGIPIDHATYLAAQQGQWSMVLTPTKAVPRDWFPTTFENLKVLGLAAGGGQQMPIFAALGARGTILDYSPAQLDSERMVARREKYEIEAIRGDMSQPLPFADNSFDLIFHPVSNVYIADVRPVWAECYRILKPGGRLLAGLDNGVNFLFADDDESQVKFSLPFDPLIHPEQMASLQASDSGVQFSHTLDEQIRGQLQAGFKLRDLYEDTNGEGFLHEHGVPTFWATWAEK